MKPTTFNKTVSIGRRWYALWLRNQNELQHYGVKGMKWGVRNGPPYPINRKISTVSRERGIRYISGALNPESDRAKAHAERYYEAVRHMTADVKRIAKNTGFSEDQIKTVKNFVFFDEHDLGNGQPERFLPSFAMAQSWQRLIDGKNIQPHDLTLLRHELFEHELMEGGASQYDAHIAASRKFDYAAESEEYHDKIKKH